MPQEITYRIDSADIIRSVNPAWDEFADANDARHLVSDAVVGSCLLSHISDPTTRHVYEVIIARVRSGCEARFRLRCDAPSRRRLLEIRISADAEGAVDFTSREVVGALRGPRRLLDSHAWRSDDEVRVCSWCNRLELNDQWYELDDGVVRARLFEQALLPRVVHSCCPQCASVLDAALDTLVKPITFSLGHEPFGRVE